MPAKSKSQLRAAHAACRRGEDWGCKMAAHTRTTKGLPDRKRPARRTRAKRARNA